MPTHQVADDPVPSDAVPDHDPGSTGPRPRGRRARALLLAAVLAAALSLLAASCVSADQTTVFNQVNNSRTSRGVRAMGANQWLSDFAQDWAEWMAANCTLGHSRTYASSNPYRWRSLAENVGRGPSLSVVHNAFMSSTSHRNNILNPNFNYVGTGVARGCGNYWVVHEFMQY